MKTAIKTSLGVLLLAGTAHAAPLPSDVIPAQGGPIRITPIYHASFQIEYRGNVIHVDPFSGGDYIPARSSSALGVKTADLILITHTHPDHLDLEAITRIQEPDTLIIAPLAAAASIHNGLISRNSANPVSVLSNGDFIDLKHISDDDRIYIVKVGAVPAYNLKRGPKPGQKFHPKGQFNGYVLTMGGKRIYIAGDTEATPEMKALKNIDVAFLPMNLPYTMTPAEAATGARAFGPKIVYPYHYRFPFDKPNNNPQQFAWALQGSGIQVRLRGWYDHPAKK